MLRYVRIAVSVVSLVACVLLIVLWVRSFRAEDRLSDTSVRPSDYESIHRVAALFAMHPTCPSSRVTFRGNSL